LLVTLILSLVTAHYALQASDRLLTIGAGNRYQPWDRVSNKSVVVLTRDGLISMGYTGPAFVGRATMDGWIAQVLTGQDLGASRRHPDFGVRVGGAGPDGFLAVHLNAIADRLNQVVNARQVTNELTIDYVGLRWQSRKKPAWPVAGRITWDPSQGGYTMAMLKRRWGWESGRNYLFRASGRSQDVARVLLRDRLSGVDLSSKEYAAAALIEVLRAIPPQDETVSLDCLVTTIQRVSPHAHIKYERYGTAQMTVTSRAGTFTQPAAFSPWIVTPGLLAAPQAISGAGPTHHSGGFDFVVEGSGPGGELSIMSSQPRRRR
jgi:hypothetical protein